METSGLVEFLARDHVVVKYTFSEVVNFDNCLHFQFFVSKNLEGSLVQIY